MMKLSHMLPITDAIDAGGLPQFALEASRRWSAGSLSYIRTSATAVFRFKHVDGPRILRLQHKEDRGPDLIQAELDFVEHLLEEGVPAARPFASDRGNTVEAIEAGDCIFHATVFEELLGERVQEEDLTTEHCRCWGQLLGAVHVASRRFDPRNGRRRHTWDQELSGVFSQLSEIPGPLREELDAALTWFRVLPLTREDYGLIHRDVELDNMVWQGKGFALFDFDDCMYNWYAADVASSIQDLWCSPEGAKRDALLGAFFEGYTERSGEVDTSLIPRFLRLAALRGVLRVGRFLEGNNPSDDPEWVGSIRARWEGRIEKLMATDFGW